MNRMRPVALGVSLCFASGCFATTSSTSTLPMSGLAPDLRVGAMSNETPFERRVEVERTEVEPPPSEQAQEQRARKIAFWSGVGMMAVGAVGTVAFGVTGRVMQYKLEQGYDETSLTRADEDRYTTVGETANILASTSAAVGVIGLIAASVAYGLDYTKCGTLAHRKRRNRCEARD